MKKFKYLFTIILLSISSSYAMEKNIKFLNLKSIPENSKIVWSNGKEENLLEIMQVPAGEPRRLGSYKSYIQGVGSFYIKVLKDGAWFKTKYLNIQNEQFDLSELFFERIK